MVLSFSFAFVVTAAAGPVVSVVACAGVLICAVAVTRGDAARRADKAPAEAAAPAAEAVIAEAEAVIAAATTPARRGRFLIQKSGLPRWERLSVWR